MSHKGRHKPLHRRIEIIRSFKMTRLMLEQIRAACDENDISFSKLMREAINQSLSRYNQQKQFLEQREKVFDSSASLVA
jgi:DNA-binding transcriptional MerR regulator